MKNAYDLVVGLGQTGLSCVKYLHQKGRRIIVADTRLNPPGLSTLCQLYPDVVVYLGEFSTHIFERAQRLVVSPGIALRTPAIQEALAVGVELSSDLELFAHEVNVPMVGITGSNGKSTVTTLVGEMCQAAGLKTGVAGNVGLPVLDTLRDQYETYVLELSSFQLEMVDTLKLKAATILNITEDHMDRYPDFKAYEKAKQRIYQHCETAIYNRHDPKTAPAEYAVRETISFGLDQPPTAKDYGLIAQEGRMALVRGDEVLIYEDELVLHGGHYTLNALAALAFGGVLALPLTIMQSVLRQFSGLPHRCQIVAKKEEVVWINDSKATNVGATIASIETIAIKNQRNIILIAGGLGKGADFRPLQEPIAQSVKAVLLIGEAAQEIAQVCEGITETIVLQDLAAAVAYAHNIAKPGDQVLLAPACASLDMFENYAHRGEVFTELVQRLI